MLKEYTAWINVAFYFHFADLLNRNLMTNKRVPNV